MTSTIETRLKMRGIVVLGCWPFHGVKVFFIATPENDKNKNTILSFLCRVQHIAWHTCVGPLF